METIVETVGEKIRRFRESAGWTLGELARKAQVNERTIRRAEAGQSIEPAIKAKIARAFGIDVGLLTNGPAVANAIAELQAQRPGGPIAENAPVTHHIDIVPVENGRGLFKLLATAKSWDVEADDADSAAEEADLVAEFLDLVEESREWPRLSLSDQYRKQVSASLLLSEMRQEKWEILAIRESAYWDTSEGAASGPEVRIRLRIINEWWKRPTLARADVTAKKKRKKRSTSDST